MGRSYGPCGIRLPRSLVAKMVQAGAEKEFVHPTEDMCAIRIVYGSRAWSLYEDWACELGEVDPMVQAHFAPSHAILGTVLVPAPALIWPLLLEVNSIISHYASLLEAAFTAALPGLPAVPGPLAGVPLPIAVHHAKVAVTSLVRRIHDPPANYSVLTGIGSGGYICDIQYMWKGAIVVVSVFKP